MNRQPKQLWRKVNSRTWNVRHGSIGRDFKYTKNKKRDTPEQVKGSMSNHRRHGRDYTPLYRFLLSKVGSDWNEVYAEVIRRLDSPDPIWTIVGKSYDLAEERIRTGESSYFSGLYIDENGTLQMKNADLKAEDMEPYCTCCTHTFNGEPFGKQ